MNFNSLLKKVGENMVKKYKIGNTKIIFKIRKTTLKGKLEFLFQ